MNPIIIPVQAVSLTIFDDLRNEQVFENKDAPFKVDKPKWTTPERPIRKPPKKALEMMNTEGEGSGHDSEMPLTPSRRPGKEPSPASDFDPEKAREKAEERNKGAISPGTVSLTSSIWGTHKLQAEIENVASLRDILFEAATTKKTTYDKPPSISNWPPNISAKGLTHWKPFFQSYGKIIKAEASLTKQWIVALAIWRNYAMKRRIAPFDPSAGFLNQDTQDYMIKRVKAGRTDSVNLVKRVIKGLKKPELIKSMAKEKLLEVEYEKSKKRFVLNSALPVILTEPFTNKGVTVALKALGFTWNGREGAFIRSTPKGQALLFYGDEDKETKAYLSTVQYLNETQTAYLLGLRETELKDIQKVLRRLKAYYKDILIEIPLVI